MLPSTSGPPPPASTAWWPARHRREPARPAPRFGTALAVAALVAAAVGACGSGGSSGPGPVPVPTRPSTFTVRGVAAPGTPAKYDQVQVRRYGSPAAPKVLVLVPGTFAGAADFDIVGPYLAAHVPGLQVWAEMRREGALEDNSMIVAGLAGKATVAQVVDYYVGWLTNKKITRHYQPLRNADVAFARDWGMRVAMGDLRNVILAARDGGKRTVVLGGHSLGGSEAAIYPAWDFDGQPGYKDLAGIVCIDGCAFAPGGKLFGTALTVSSARTAVDALTTRGPWLDLLGVGLPWISGALGELGAVATLKAPAAPSALQSLKLLPPAFVPSVPTTNRGLLGWTFDASTAPAALALTHVHSGHLATTAGPRGWVDDGPTPVGNIASVFAREPLGAIDWYYPARLTIDDEAAATLQPTAVTRYLGLPVTHLKDVNVPLYAIQTSLGGVGNTVANGAHYYQAHSRIPSVDIVSRPDYGHLDPLLAAPARNAFLQTVVPWLTRIPG